jgi:hypothetical protein
MYDSYTVPRLYESDFVDYSNQEVQDRMNENKDRLGSYSFQPSRGQQLTLQFFANYTHTFAEDYNFNVFYGMEYRKSTSVNANMGAYEFMLQDSHGDGFYSWQNLNDETYRTHGITLYHTSWNKYGYFGEVRFDYKGVAQISGTWRHDGSSRFKQNYKTSYFYPSVTAGVIFSELFHLTNNWFSYGKLRGN